MHTQKSQPAMPTLTTTSSPPSKRLWHRPTLTFVPLHATASGIASATDLDTQESA